MKGLIVRHSWFVLTSAFLLQYDMCLGGGNPPPPTPERDAASDAATDACLDVAPMAIGEDTRWI